MADAHKNFAISTISTPPSPASSGTTLVVAAGEGTKFPAAPFNCVIWPVGATATTQNAEIVRVTNVATDTLTIVRTQESTASRSIVTGDQIVAGITAKTLTDAESAGAQTPWASAINGGGFSLTNVNAIAAASANLSGLTASKVIGTDGGKNLVSYDAGNGMTISGGTIGQTPKIYRALLSQSGTDAPVVTVLENSLGGAVVWTLEGNGYQGTATLAGAFVLAKTFVLLGDNTALNSPDKTRYTFTVNAPNSITITWYDSVGDAAGSPPTNLPVQFLTYP